MPGGMTVNASSVTTARGDQQEAWVAEPNPGESTDMVVHIRAGSFGEGFRGAGARSVMPYHSSEELPPVSCLHLFFFGLCWTNCNTEAHGIGFCQEGVPNLVSMPS